MGEQMTKETEVKISELRSSMGWAKMGELRQGNARAKMGEL